MAIISLLLMTSPDCDENFADNDTLYSFVVNFDNFRKNTHLRFAERHKAKVT